MQWHGTESHEARCTPSTDCSSPPIIYTHYGICHYLPTVLRQTRRSNPEKSCILIGDESNRVVAERTGWCHIDMDEIVSPRRDQFNATFRWIQGRDHGPVKGGRDWLRYVFERFFMIEQVLQSLWKDEIDRQVFWHFDSDTMILEDLLPFDNLLDQNRLDCTTLCNGICPSGLLRAGLLRRYCDYILEIFSNKRALIEEQAKYDNGPAGHAFTEMVVFARLCEQGAVSVARLGRLVESQGYWFDDCICQGEGGFSLVYAEMAGRMIKDLRKCDHKVVGGKENTNLTFVTVNCSWVPQEAFDWLEGVAMGNHVALSLGHALRLPAHLLVERALRQPKVVLRIMRERLRSYLVSRI